MAHTADVGVVREVYDAVGRGDLDHAVATLADDVEWIEPHGGPYEGTYHGPEAVRTNVFAGLRDEFAAFVVEPDRFVVDGGTVVALVTHRGTYAETGERFEAPVVDVWELEDGEVTKFQHYVGDLGYVRRRTTG
jgi:hypothetical protein